MNIWWGLMLPLWILCGCRQFVKLRDSCSFSRAYCHLLGTNCFTFGVDFCSTNKVRSLFLLLILEILLKYYWKISRQQWALTNQPKQSSSRTKEWTWKRYGLFVLLGAETSIEAAARGRRRPWNFHETRCENPERQLGRGPKGNR